MPSPSDKAAAFRALHERPGAFIIPNPWDAGTARLLAALGFEALATTSLGLANMLGRSDASVSRAEVIANCRAIVEATPLPVNVDLENGFAHRPEEAAEAIRLAAEAGAAGGSIEDFSGDRNDAIYDFDLSVARVKAAVAVARAQPVPFLLTARAENHLYGHGDLDDTVARLIAYRDAGADVLYAPGLRDLDQIARVVREVDAPVNVLVLPGGPSVRELGDVGVRRVSTGGALSSVAYGAAVQAAQELLEAGTATYPTGLPRELRAAAFRPR